MKPYFKKSHRKTMTIKKNVYFSLHIAKLLIKDYMFLKYANKIYSTQ